MFSKIRTPLMRGARATQVLGKLPVANRFPTSFAVRSFSAQPPVDPNEAAKIVATFSNEINSPTVTEAVTDAATAVVAVAPEKLNIISTFLMEVTNQAHVALGLPYWEAILAVTVALRLLLFPVAVKTIQSSSRMACMRPDMERLTNLMNADPNKNDPATQKRYQMEMKGLMVKHQINPVRAMLWPFAQLPIFLGFFFALREMGNFYPEITTGGAFWFENLSAADPYYILPILNAVSFLAMIEIGSDGIQQQQSAQFKMVMRGISVMMIPLTASLPASLFMYWLPNNVMSAIQTQILKREGPRNFFKIPKVPETPATNMPNPLTKISEILKKEKSDGLGAKPTFLNVSPSEEAKPAATTASAAPTKVQPTGKPAVTYSSPPKRKSSN